MDVTLTDPGTGTLAATYTVNGSDVDESTYAFAFANSYNVTGAASLNLSGLKKITGKALTANEFTFELYDGNTLLATAKNGADGKFSFTNVVLNRLGTYTLTVVEKNTGATGIVYDARRYSVQVQVTDNGVGGMQVASTAVTLDGKAAELVFENAFKPADTPRTGDSFSPLTFGGLMILSSFGITAVVISKKKEEAEESAQ